VFVLAGGRAKSLVLRDQFLGVLVELCQQIDEQKKTAVTGIRRRA
jgi:hypothetical protein